MIVSNTWTRRRSVLPHWRDPRCSASKSSPSHAWFQFGPPVSSLSWVFSLDASSDGNRLFDREHLLAGRFSGAEKLQ